METPGPSGDLNNTMDFNLNLPCCPVCNSEARVVTRKYPGDESSVKKLLHYQTLQFQCRSAYSRSAYPDQHNKERVKGPWSSWSLDGPCSRAHEVALKLLADRENKHGSPTF